MLEKNKITIATVILFILICITLILTYLRFYVKADVPLQEVPINESSSNAIHEALQTITTNFNQNSDVKEYIATNNINLTAVVNNYSIYISYIDGTTTTYEFNYENLCLNITINNDQENIEKFNLVYKFLINAIQTRINNTAQYDEIVSDFLTNDNTNYDGLIKEKIDNKIKYQVNITKKLSVTQN